MTHLWMLLFDVFVLGGVCLMGGILFLWKYQAQRAARHSPLARHVLRSPGESLRARIEELQWDIASYLGMGMLPFPLVLGLYFATWVGAGHAPSTPVSGFLALFALVTQGWFARKLWKALARLRDLRLGYEAQVAVGRELGELGRSGFRIFHDFPADSRNIDHVLVGPGGVFCIETEGRAKGRRRQATDTPWEVKYDGQVLEFPGWEEREPLAQAHRNAEWLQLWLSSAVGQPMAVQPVVALPGWFVRGTGADGMPVLAAGQVEAYFASRPRNPSMTPQFIQQIVHQLDQKCRDVAPRSYPRSENGASFEPAGS